MKNTSLRTVIFLAALGAATSLMLAAQDIVAVPAAPVVPHVIKISGAMPDAPAAASVVEVKFALYAAQTGGDPLWSETQQVALDPLSHYAVLLGAASPNGLPDALFAAGAAKWLGVTLAGGAESPRSLMSANAYALKASDAETLGGHPVSDFKLATKPNGKPDTAVDITTVNAGTGITVTGNGTATVTVGINTAYLDTLGAQFAALAGTNKFTGSNTFTGTTKLAATTLGNTTITGTLSVSGSITSAFLNSIAAEFPLLAGANKFTAANTFSMPITFAASQTFPGTLKSVTASSPLTATTTSGAVAVGINATALETDLNALYAQLAVAHNTFTGSANFGSYVEADEVAGAGTAAVLGFGSSGSVGTFGNSDTGYGLQGTSTSGQGVLGDVFTPVAGSEGVLGYTGSAFSAEYSAEAGVAYAGVWADSSATGAIGIPLGLFATSDSGYAGGFVNNSANFPALFVDNNDGTGAAIDANGTGDGIDVSAASGNGVSASTAAGGSGVVGTADAPTSQQAGVEGVAVDASATGGEFNIYGAVWGDTGVSSTAISPAWAIGLLGTADDSHAGVFLNNSTNGWSTLYVSNAGTGGTGLVTPREPGLFDTIMAVSRNGTCGVGSGSLSCTGQIKSLVSAGGTRTVETYAMQSPENWMEDFGAGSMAHGKAVINIDPAFAETISRDGSYHVFLTPNGDSKGLYVSAKSAGSFEVRESGGGTSSLNFDYRIVAKRLGYEAQRLTDVTESLARESARETIAISTSPKKATVARKISPLEQALKTPHRTIVPSPAPRKLLPPRPVAASAHEVASR